MDIRPFHYAAFFGMTLLGAQTALADETTHSPYSTTLYGPLGLNTIPSARMDKIGTVRAQVSTLDPYANASIGVQLANPLYVNLRQSAEVSDINDDALRLFPGVDAKLRLMKETAHRPEISIGLQSAVGHKRMAGEYIALSKRYKSFDFTAGIGWGRFAGAGHFANPLGGILQHFKDPRPIDGEISATAADWFTGEKIGVMGGIEYFTPLDGLSLKADIGGDRFEAEKAAFNYEPGAPWSIGFNYKPRSFVDIGVAVQGTDKLMARLSLQSLVQNWRDQSTYEQSKPKTPLSPYRSEASRLKTAQKNAWREGINLTNTSVNQNSASASLALRSNHAAPYQIGRAAVHLANHAGSSPEEIKISPTHRGLRGPSLRLLRRDLEKALRSDKQGSAEEIWHSAEIDHDFSGLQKLRPAQNPDLSFKNINLTLQNQISLSEEDEGILYRTALIAENDGPVIASFMTTHLGLRLNLADNLDELNDLRPRIYYPTRSNIDEFADRFFALDTAYISTAQTLAPDFHASVMAGYLEEMYTGIGGEILYRPFDKRIAIGAESFAVFRRDPDSIMNLELNGDSILTIHANAWYDIPEADVTIGAKVGRYLAGDLGATLSLHKNFKNGVKLEGYTTLSAGTDFDLFGGTTSADHGIRVSLPLGGFKYTPKNSKIDVLAAPLGRDIGQSVKNPMPLYELSQPLTKAHFMQHWDKITN